MGNSFENSNQFGNAQLAELETDGFEAIDFNKDVFGLEPDNFVLDLDALDDDEDLIVDSSSFEELGQSHPDWIQFCDVTLATRSKEIYIKGVFSYLEWRSSHRMPEVSLELNLKAYFCEIADKKNEDDTYFYARTKFRSMASVFLAFWTYTGAFG